MIAYLLRLVVKHGSVRLFVKLRSGPSGEPRSGGQEGSQGMTEEDESVADSVLAVLGEVLCSIKPASAAITTSSTMEDGCLPPLRSARSRWNSANVFGSPSRIYCRDCDGESQALFGMSASLWVRGWDAARFRWNSAKDMSSPARMYRRDCDGECSELLDGVSESCGLPVEEEGLTSGQLVCKGVSWGSA